MKTKKSAGDAKKAAHADEKKAAVVSRLNKGGAPRGNRNSAKYALHELPDVHKKLCAHLENGYSWTNFPDMSEQSIRHHIARGLPEFPEEPLRAAHRRGVAKIHALALDVAAGKQQGNSRLLIFLLRNKGLSDQPIDPALEILNPTAEKQEARPTLEIVLKTVKNNEPDET